MSGTSGVSLVTPPSLVLSELRAKLATLVNEQLEAALLGALLMNCKLLEAVPDSFHPEHLAFADNDDLFRLIYAVSEGVCAGSTILEVGHRLGGDRATREMLVGLTRGMISMYPGNVKSYALTLTDLHRRRKLVEVAHQVTDEILTQRRDMPADAVISRTLAQLELLLLGGPEARAAMTLAEAASAAIEHGDRVRRGETHTGLSTGFATLDGVIGGLEPGALYVLAGRPGMGKSALGLQIALAIAKTDTGVLFTSLEMQATQLARRALAIDAGIDLAALKRGAWSAADAGRLVQAQQAYRNLPITIEDQGGLSTQMIAVRARAAKRRHGLGLLVIDHMHIVAGDPGLTKSGPTAVVDKISGDLKRMAKELDIPVLALAQLNRGVEARDDKRPGKADLRQSGAIEQDAECIMFLYRPEYYLPKNEPERRPSETDAALEKRVGEWRRSQQEMQGKAEVIFGKVRDGEEQVVTLNFHSSRIAFEEMDQ